MGQLDKIEQFDIDPVRSVKDPRWKQPGEKPSEWAARLMKENVHDSDS